MFFRAESFFLFSANFHVLGISDSIREGLHYTVLSLHLMHTTKAAKIYKLSVVFKLVWIFLCTSGIIFPLTNLQMKKHVTVHMDCRLLWYAKFLILNFLIRLQEKIISECRCMRDQWFPHPLRLGRVFVHFYLIFNKVLQVKTQQSTLCRHIITRLKSWAWNI